MDPRIIACVEKMIAGGNIPAAIGFLGFGAILYVLNEAKD